MCTNNKTLVSPESALRVDSNDTSFVLNRSPEMELRHHKNLGHLWLGALYQCGSFLMHAQLSMTSSIPESCQRNWP